MLGLAGERDFYYCYNLRLRALVLDLRPTFAFIEDLAQSELLWISPRRSYSSAPSI